MTCQAEVDLEPRPRPCDEVNLVHGRHEGQVELVHGTNVEIDLVHGHDE